jgi:uncharacterized protein with HEPN domain
MSRSVELYVNDILEFMDRAEEYLEGLNMEELLRGSSKRLPACLKSFPAR